MRTPIIIESPLAGCFPLNRAYLAACIRDCLARGETPYASHKMLDGPLDDLVPEERELGISAGLDMRAFMAEHGARIVFYTDLGWSGGMQRALADAGQRSLNTESRILTLGTNAWGRVLAEAAKKDELFRSCLLELAPYEPGWGVGAPILKARDLYLEREAA